MKKRIEAVESLLSSIIESIHEKQGKNVLKIDLRKIESRVTDFFIVCHASSTSQVSAICDFIEDNVKKQTGEKRLRTEGLENCFWVLIDYGNVVVHIFIEEYRSFYNLESLWADAKIEIIEDKKIANNG